MYENTYILRYDSRNNMITILHERCYRYRYQHAQITIENSAKLSNDLFIFLFICLFYVKKTNELLNNNNNK